MPACDPVAHQHHYPRLLRWDLKDCSTLTYVGVVGVKPIFPTSALLNPPQTQVFDLSFTPLQCNVLVWLHMSQLLCQVGNNNRDMTNITVLFSGKVVLWVRQIQLLDSEMHRNAYIHICLDQLVVNTLVVIRDT